MTACRRPLELPSLPTVRVSESALRGNLRALRAHLPVGSRFGAVVKADGYGHGMLLASRAALAEGARFLIVVNAAEALALREAGIEDDVLVVGPTFPQEAAPLVERGVSVTIGSLDAAKAFAAAAQAANRPARVHVKIDTGMGRFGFLEGSPEYESALDCLPETNGLRIEGLATHFSEADVPDSDFTELQLGRFRTALERFKARGVRPEHVHAANSGATVHFPETLFSLARFGIAMYGPCPGPEPAAGWDLTPVMTMTCRVADVRVVPAGTPVSYGRRFTTSRPSRLGILAAGYGDGYPRRAGFGGATTLIRGRRAPIVGTVTMNQMIVDLTDLPDAGLGDEALLFGRSEDGTLRVDEVARAAGTISYEVLCNAGHAARAAGRLERAPEGAF